MPGLRRNADGMAVQGHGRDSMPGLRTACFSGSSGGLGLDGTIEEEGEGHGEFESP